MLREPKLKAIRLKNFKPFKMLTEVDFAPITRIYGQNSAGKSSILQALNLMKQTLESHRDPNTVLLPMARDGFSDLGSFRELLSDHDLREDLAIGVTVGSENTFWKTLPTSTTLTPVT